METSSRSTECCKSSILMMPLYDQFICLCVCKIVGGALKYSIKNSIGIIESQKSGGNGMHSIIECLIAYLQQPSTINEIGISNQIQHWRWQSS